MTTKDIITDTLIDIVFEGTNFGGQPHRDVVNKNIQQVADGYHIGRTAKCCLVELGLIITDDTQSFRLTHVGSTYLDCLRKESNP